MSSSFTDSASYWESRYARGGNSGPGSYHKLAAFKAGVLNDFVRKNNIYSVIEFGCGDGNQLSLSEYPSYLGLDVSPTAIRMCRERFRDDPSKEFKPVSDYSNQRADLALSLDVIFHLVEDDCFDNYMKKLFGASDKHVIIYSSDSNNNEGMAPHVRHRQFTAWVKKNKKEWTLKEILYNPYPYNPRAPRADTGSFCDFFFYERDGG